MKCCVITNPGIEKISAKEINELVGVETQISESVVTFKTDEVKDVLKICYVSQSAAKVMQLLFSGQAIPFESLLDEIKQLDLSKLLVDSTFAVRAKIIDNDSIDTMECEALIGEVIHEKYKAPVDLENPCVKFFLYVVDKNAYFGVDFTGFDIAKRTYRVFGLSDSIKATIAYAMVRIAGYAKDKIIVDPFVYSGSIPVESAHFALGKSVRFYDKDRFAFNRLNMLKDFDFDSFFADNDSFSKDLSGILASSSQQNHVRAAEKNAKVSGVNKQISFTRMDVEWLDTKFEKHSVDAIVSNPPKISRLLTEKGLEKVFQELFYTADFILKSEGRIVLLVKNYVQILKHAQRHNFTLKANLPVRQGKDELSILVFVKETA